MSERELVLLYEGSLDPFTSLAFATYILWSVRHATCGANLISVGSPPLCFLYQFVLVFSFLALSGLILTGN